MGKVYWQSQESQMQEHGETPDILALGDSWFAYPLNNLLNPINRYGGEPTILGFGEIGAESGDLLNKTHFDPFIKSVAGYPSVRIVVISAGGNDFAGLEDFEALLNPDCKGLTESEQCYKPGEPASLFQKVGDAYSQMIERTLQARKRVTVLLHSYDYAIPTGIGFLGLGQWLKAPMDACKVSAKDALQTGSLRREIVVQLIDEFHRVLTGIAQQSGGKVICLQTAGTLGDADWANELHPTVKGFNKLGREKFAPVVKEILG